MSSPAKVLAINFGGIGDEVLFLPTLERIKELAPDCELTLLVEPRSKSVMEVTNLIDKIITFDIKKKPLTPVDLIRLTMLLRTGGYDMVISSGSSPMVAMLLFLSGIKLRVGYDSGSPVKSLLTHPVKLLREQYAADMYHDLTKGMANYLRRKANANASIRDVDHTYQVPKVTLKAESLATMKAFLEEGLRATQNAVTTDDTKLADISQIDTRPVKTVLIHPGTSQMAVSKGIIKHWSSENWLTFIRLLQNQKDQPFQTRVILCGGPDDKEVVAELERLLKADSGQGKNGSSASAAPYISAVGKTKGLADLAALTSLCDVLVCVDSAPMHIGVGLNKNLVALFGPTDPKLLIPNQKNFKVLADRPAATASPPRSLQDGLGVRLHPESVYQSLLDLLREESSQ
ncbi:glycosyltransferase family 9 protein [bacterium]|nr:glycosyltransferase family 9 protein [bacterium]MBP9806847.1 glycosyltransferase family 9 protein [bacterium]